MADYVPTQGKIYVNDPVTGYGFKLAIYNSAGSLLTNGSSGSTIYPESGYPQWLTVTFTSLAALTPGNKYYIILFGDYYPKVASSESENWYVSNKESVTWPTAPATIDPAEDAGGQSDGFSIYCANASGQLLIGSNTTYTTDKNPSHSEDAIYFRGSDRTGYTCVTLAGLSIPVAMDIYRQRRN